MRLDENHVIKRLDNRNICVVEECSKTIDGLKVPYEKPLAYCTSLSEALKWGIDFLLNDLAKEDAKRILKEIEIMKKMLLEEVRKLPREVSNE